MKWKHHLCHFHKPLVRVRWRRWAWYGRGTPHGSCWWAGFPCRIPCPHPASVSTGSPADSRSIPPPCGRHPELSPLALHPRCSDPWPSCCPLHSVLYTTTTTTTTTITTTSRTESTSSATSVLTFGPIVACSTLSCAEQRQLLLQQQLLPLQLI